MTNENMNELKTHIRWLEDEISYGDDICGRLDEIEGDISVLWKSVEGYSDILKEHLNKQYGVLESVVAAVNNQAANLKDLIDAINNNTAALKAAVAAAIGKTPPAPPPSIFDEVLNNLKSGRRPQKFKPKVVVKNDQPDDVA